MWDKWAQGLAVRGAAAARITVERNWTEHPKPMSLFQQQPVVALGGVAGGSAPAQQDGAHGDVPLGQGSQR
jgi:hypothetical protein